MLNKGYLTAENNAAADKQYTPRTAVEPLVKYIKKDAVIWCPFDTDKSEYVKVFRENGFKVINSSLTYGQDFFTYEPEEEYDVIISNPPFSLKDKVLKRLYELDKPYAMLLPVPVLQGQARFEFMRADPQWLGFDKRINFYKDEELTIKQSNVSFGTGYFCKHFLPRDLILEKI